MAGAAALKSTEAAILGPALAKIRAGEFTGAVWDTYVADYRADAVKPFRRDPELGMGALRYYLTEPGLLDRRGRPHHVPALPHLERERTFDGVTDPVPFLLRHPGRRERGQQRGAAATSAHPAGAAPPSRAGAGESRGAPSA